MIRFNFDGVKPNLAEIYERFRALGTDVGYLTTTFNDRGLVDEGFSWYGVAKLNPIQPSETIFEPSAGLKAQPFMDQLTPTELLVCHIKYLEGLTSSALQIVNPAGMFSVLPPR